MYVTRSTGPAYIELYVLPGLNQSNGQVPSSHSAPAYVGDPTFNDLLYNVAGSRKPFLKSAPMRVVDTLSVAEYVNELPRDNGFLIQKPQKIAWSGQRDWERYGSLFGVLNRFNQTSDDAYVREHDVSHISFVGDVEDKLTSRLYWRNGLGWTSNYVGDPIYPLYFHDIPTPIGEFRLTDINDQGNFVFEFRQSAQPYCNSYHPDFDYYDFVERRAAFIQNQPGGEIVVNPDGTDAWRYYSRDVINNSVKKPNYYHIDVRYELEIEGHGYYFGEYFVRSFYDVHLDFTVAFVSAPRGSTSLTEWTPISPETVKLTDNSSVSVTDSYEWRAEYGPRYFLPWPDLTAGLHVRLISDGLDPTRVVSVFSPPSQSSSSQSNLMRLRRQGTLYDDVYVTRLKRSHDINMPSIRASCFYSASDALHESIDVISSNNLENLAQLKGILDLLPDLPELGRLIAKVTRKDPSALIDLINYITDAILKYRFAQAPTADDVSELLTTDIQSQLSEILSLNTYTTYGKFFHEFQLADNPLGGAGLTTLVTRSKVRLTFDMSNLMATYLVGNSVGLLPTLSRIWAVVPFSFVVDWFTNMDDRLQAVDDQLLWMAITTQWCLHSYSVTYYPTPEELEVWNLEQVEGGEPFGIKIYTRELSLCMPKLVESKYDYLAPDNGPDPITVGSLVWQSIS